MSTIKDIAKKIPDEVRSLRILTENNPIFNATNSINSHHMILLTDVWYTFIEPNKERSTCPICLENILTNFIQMQEILIELEQDYQKLKLL
jgi:hypothetical protein